MLCLSRYRTPMTCGKISLSGSQIPPHQSSGCVSLQSWLFLYKCVREAVFPKAGRKLWKGGTWRNRDAQVQWPVRNTLHMFFFHRWRYSWRVFIQSNCHANYEGKMPSLLEVHGWVIRHTVSPMRRSCEREVGPQGVCRQLSEQEPPDRTE